MRRGSWTFWDVSLGSVPLERLKTTGLEVPNAGYEAYVLGSIHGWNRSRLTYTERLPSSKAQSHFAVSLNYS